MADYSLNQLLDWMKEQPRTLGWGMICAFDRTQLNTLLTQEYIRRFKTSSYLDPVSGTIPNGDGLRFALKDFTLDRPRLSFEDVDLNDSKARLRMRAVGGTQLRLNNVGGQWHTREIREISPLQGPELSLNLRLDQVPGVVGEHGELRLDLKYSDDFRMTVSQDRIEQSLVGAYFQQKFAALDDEKRVFPIGRIERGDNELLRPQSFVMRTQARRRTADDPEGAVLGFVRWEGDPEGTLPTANSDFRYLIPHDGDRSATVLMGSARVLLSLVLKTFETTAEQGVFRIIRDNDGRITGADSTQGYVLTQSIILPQPVGANTVNFRAYFDPVPIGDSLKLSLTSSRRLAIEWSVSTHFVLKLLDLDLVMPEERRAWNNCRYDISHIRTESECSYFMHAGFRLTDADGIMATYEDVSQEHLRVPLVRFDDARPKLTNPAALCKQYLEPFEYLIDGAAHAMEESLWHPTEGLVRLAHVLLDSKLSFNDSIRGLLLNTVKLNFGNTVIADELRAPDDVGIFGRVNPQTTSFVISPLEHNLVVGTTRQFTVTPATDNLKWSVEPILASVLSDQIGTIDPQTGLYTAPTADSFAGPFVRLRVTATSQSNDYSSSALVTVLRNALQVNPVAYVMQAGAAMSLEAGYLGEADRLTWTIKDASLGGAVAGQGLTAQYTAPQTMPPSDPDDPYDSGLAFIADEVEVRDTASGVPSTAVVIVESATKSPMLVTREVDPATGSVQLVAFINGRPRDPAKVEWDVRHGPGTFGNTNGKPNGVYTSGPSGDQTFALLTATYRSEDDGVFEGYVLQPLPISELEAAVRGTGVYALANVNEGNRP